MSKTMRWALALGALSLPSVTWADSMRCGTHLIEAGGRHGDGKYEVLKKCGDPRARTGNTWIYVRGSTRFIVTFNDAGRILSINQRPD